LGVQPARLFTDNDAVSALSSTLVPATQDRPLYSSRLSQRAFTLLEVIVVVAILAILATVVTLNVADAPGQARQARAKQDVQTLTNALNLYKLDNFSFPSTEQGLEALVSRPAGQPEAPNWKNGGYLQGNAVIKDPWNRAYLYLTPGRRGEIDVYSLGADGRPGGEGENADVGNWVE
jgi:general secretion pathway protein G